MIGYVITILGLPHSEASAARCIESGQRHGIQVEAFPAVNRYHAEEVMRDLALFPNATAYSHISDEPIGDREAEKKGQWHLTTPELGCALSHYLVWCKAARSTEPTLILEHDTVLVAPVPLIPPDALAVNYHAVPVPGTAAYAITPTAANLAIAHTKSCGVEPSDELLWRSALKGLPVHQERQPVIAIDDKGISTIQWTRTDDIHAAIARHDPWTDFQDPAEKNKKDT